MSEIVNQNAVLQYVRASAALLDLPLDDEQARRVAGHLARSAGMAKLLEAVPLLEDDEPAEIYRPAPFPDLADPSAS